MAGEIDDKRSEDIARHILEMEKKMRIHNFNESSRVLVSWNGGIYIGAIQAAAPGFSKEIVFLSKTSNPIEKKIADAIRNIDKEILELIADDYIDLTGRYHIIRKLENRLTKMTVEQTIYMVNRPVAVKEVNLNPKK